ncbi:FkbM family methyltransferase [Nitrosopumilus sp.]|uniref:FkbM family methyltransferase n=1 Tax=Nitrosopumilus sp. TaxID=2024843 RepID=UPI00292D2106|nr:FkbM family methyltransferase [Nitrosopumilus sp.]
MTKLWVHDFGKFRMVLDESDMDLSRQVRMLGEYSTESFEAKVCKEYLKPGQTVLDIGANIGFYTLIAASNVGPNGKVFAFEPSVQNVEMIGKSVAENSMTNVHVSNVAVSDKSGLGELYLSPYYQSEHSLFEYHYSSGTHSGKKTTVELVIIDEFLEQNCNSLNVDFIKMDIEGAESRALCGMKKTLKENKHLTMITEFWPQGFHNANSSPQDFLEKLSSYDFTISHIDEYQNKVYPVTVNEMMTIINDRVKNPTEKTKETQAGGWYTNILCVK